MLNDYGNRKWFCGRLVVVIDYAGASALRAVPLGVAFAAARHAGNHAFCAATWTGNDFCTAAIAAFNFAGAVAVRAFVLAVISAAGASVASEAATALAIGAANLAFAIAQLAFAVAVIAELAVVRYSAGAFTTRAFFA